ncbi:MAG TPA: HAMP domain-containing sensor histidine kinase [Gemmatimonadales bacterium]|nr:HAMP domain-containing sensor histidine kinase [Gemmatimonadales bacterium]
MSLAALNSVRTRLVLLFCAITAASVGFVYLYVVPQLESNLTAEKLTRLESKATAQRGRLEAAQRSGLAPHQLEALLRRVSQFTDSRVTLLGIRPGDSRPSFVVADSEPAQGPVSAGFGIAVAPPAGGSAAGVQSLGGSRSAEVTLGVPATRPSWVVVFSEPLGEVDGNVALIKRQILIAGGIALALALLAGLWAARAISRRLGRLEDAAQKVADGDFASPIPVDSSDELGQLARTFNEMQRRLADLDSARKQFIANASHELRTPIFSLGGFVELLEDEDPDPDARAEFVRTMREQVERLTKLTTDLLDLSKLDADAMEIAPHPVDLGNLARQVAREFGPAADAHGSRLELRTPREPAMALADPDRVRQIIRILLSNALTHTPEGTKVTVSTYRAKSRAELAVSDEGPGMPKRVRERIFERFYTGDSVSGSGLGLAIGRELAQRMGGTIAVTSSKGFTAFTLDLPQAPAEPAPRVLPASEARA